MLDAYDRYLPFNRYIHQPRVSGQPRDCGHDMETVSRLDVARDSRGAECHLAKAMPVDSHHVDADAYRCGIPEHGLDCDRNGPACRSLARRVSTAGNRVRFGNPRGSKPFLSRPIVGCRGQALLELAFAIPLIVILIGATISFGLFFFQANVLQQAVDVAAQETARMPFPATSQLGLGDLDADFMNGALVMNDSAFKQQIYDEQYLVIHDDEWDENTAFGGNFQAYVAQLPLLNRLLTIVMIRDDTYAQGVTRYPGAIVANGTTLQETVLIPIVDYSSDGSETIVQWVAPVEEIRPGGGDGPYALNATNAAASFVPGTVALRINYPAQSTTLMNRVGKDGQTIVNADDAAIADGAVGSSYSLVVPNEAGPADTAIHSGRYGLGRQAALFRSAGVRPFRRVMSVQAIYRREVFE